MKHFFLFSIKPKTKIFWALGQLNMETRHFSLKGIYFKFGLPILESRWGISFKVCKADNRLWLDEAFGDEFKFKETRVIH